MRYRFGDHRLDLQAGTLRGPRGDVHLRLKTFELLRELVGRAGQVVPRDELRRAVWGEVHLGDDALAQAVSELRRALGDDSRTPRYIETLHRRGYRFVCAVVAVADSAGPPSEPVAIATPAAARRCPARPARWAWALVVPGFLGSALLGSKHDSPPRSAGVRVAVLDLQPEGGAATQWLCEAVPELLAEELERHPGIAVYSRARLARAQSDLGLASTPAAAQVRDLQRYLDADVVAGGTCRRESDMAAVRLTLHDGSGEDPRLEIGQRFPLNDIAWQAEKWSRQIARLLVPHQTEPPAQRVKRSVPASVFEGYYNARRLLPLDPRGALALLDTAAVVRPRSARLQWSRAQALLSLGDRDEALEAARLARNRKPGREGEVEYYRTAGEPEAALAVLTEIAPGREPELWLDTLQDLESAGRPGAILAALDRLDGAFDGSWLEAEFALVEARAARLLGHASRQAAAARRALRVARDRGHRFTAERALALEADLAHGGPLGTGPSGS